MTRLGTRIGLFVLVVAGVIAVAGVGGFAMADSPPDRSDATVDKAYYTSQDLLKAAELAPRSGDIELADKESRTVLISTDGQVSDLEPVVQALVAHGHEVRIHGGDAGSFQTVGSPLQGIGMGSTSVTGATGGIEEELTAVDALFAVGGSQFQDEDFAAIEAFAENGSVVLATDPTGMYESGASDELTSRFGVTVGDGYLYDMAENDANYQRIYAAGSDKAISGDAESVVLDTAAPVVSHNGTTVLEAADASYSATRTSDSYPVAVTSGNVLVIGDTDFMAPLDYNRLGNDELIGGMLSFLTDTPENPYEPTPEQPTGPVGPTPPNGTSYPPSEPPTEETTP